MKTIAIYGGSFDPPHNGHLFIAKKLTEIFDQVLIVPSFVSPFKSRAQHYKHRIKMLKIGLREQGIKAKICDYEIKKQGISYTVDTILHLRSPDKKLYFVLGSENLASLNLWHNIEKLKEMVTFLVVPRLGFDLPKIDFDVNPDIKLDTPDIKLDTPDIDTNPDIDKKFKGFNIEYAPFKGPDISSSLIKAAIAFDKAHEMLPAKILKYISKHGLYQDYKKFTNAFKSFNLSLKPKRIQHTFLAVKYGIHLAKIHGEDVDKAITALILHDIAKYADDEVLQKNSVNAGDLSAVSPPCAHAFAGEAIARQYFLIKDQDVLNAIKYHTTGRPNMSRLEKIVALADKLEESRSFDGVDKMRAAASLSLDRAMALVLKGTIEKLELQKREIDKLSLDALKYYNKENN